MKRIYVAGAYSADNVLDVLKNIGRGEQVCADLFLKGYAPFCPWHDKDFVLRNWDKDFTVKMFYDYSMAWLEVSDEVWVLPDSGNSKGTQAEIKRAKELDIPVIYLSKCCHKPIVMTNGGVYVCDIEACSQCNKMVCEVK